VPLPSSAQSIAIDAGFCRKEHKMTMDRAATPPTEMTAPSAAPAGPDADDELLVEEVSIDGMCGVY
jgi:mycofactocin precursor